jgi:hypothetical protein
MGGEFIQASPGTLKLYALKNNLIRSISNR